VGDFTAIDLFAGAGGLSLGLRMAGFRQLLAVDNNERALSTYRANHDSPTLCFDLSAASIQGFVDAAGEDIDGLDLLAGGPPCQGFSYAGKHFAGDDRNTLLLRFADYVRLIQPKYFVVENVPGLMADRHESHRTEFIEKITDAGYRIVLPIRLLLASDFGVPQLRSRVVIFGYQEDRVAPSYPTPLPNAAPTVGDAFRSGESDEPFARFIRWQEAYGYIPDSIVADVAPSCTGNKIPIHSPEVRKRFAKLGPGERDSVSRFTRLDTAGQSPTLRAGTGPARGSFMAVRPIHPDQDRCITVREAARLHSFPDWYVLPDEHWHGFMQIGNSVPPLLAAAIGTAVREAIEKGRHDE